MRLTPLLLRPKSSPWLHHHHHHHRLSAAEPAVSGEIFHILDSISPIEPALDSLPPIKPSTVSFVLREYPNLQLGFRFFIWAVKRAHIFNKVFGEPVVELLKIDGGFDLYWRTLEEVKGCGIKIAPNACVALIFAYARLGMLEKSVESFGKMRDFDCEPDCFTYNSLLHVLVKNGLLLLALAVYNQMLKSNCSPDRSTYNILINGSCKSGEIEDAFKMFDEMSLRGISADKMTYTIVISGLCRARKADHALKLFDTMRANKINPDLVTCNALIHGFCKLWLVDRALELVRQFEGDGYVLGLEGFSCVIDGLFKIGRFHDAIAWFKRASEVGIEPDVVLYSILIRGISRAGRLKDVMRVMDEMNERGLVLDTVCYNTVIKAFCDSGLLGRARGLQRDCIPSVYTYTILISGLCRNGFLGEARVMLDEMEKLGCYPSVVTFNTLINGLCKAGNVEEAKLLFYKMEIGRRPSLFFRLSQGVDRVNDRASLQMTMETMCESGNIANAYKLLTRLSNSGAYPNLETYNILMNGFCKVGEINGAYMLFKEMQLRKCLPPDSVTYGTLITGLLRAGREKDAFEVLDNMLKNGCTPSSSNYKAIMTWTCRKGEVSRAFSLWLKHLRNHTDREEEDLKAIEEHFKRGDVEVAIRALIEMDRNLDDFDSGPYTIWLIGFCQARRAEEALKIFYLLQEYHIDVTPPSCVMLINSLCKERKLDLAVEVFNYSIDKGLVLKPRICNLLLKSLLRYHKEKSRVFEILNRMKSMGYNLNDHLHRSTKTLLFQSNPARVKTESAG